MDKPYRLLKLFEQKDKQTVGANKIKQILKDSESYWLTRLIENPEDHRYYQGIVQTLLEVERLMDDELR